MAVVASVAALVGAACGGGDDLPRYFADLEAVLVAGNAQTAAVDEEFRYFDAQATRAQAFAELPDVYSHFQVILGNSADRIAALEPPSEVEEAQTEVHAALSDVAELFASLADGVAQVATDAEFAAVFATLDAEARLGRFEAACFEMEHIAIDHNDIAVDLRCEDQPRSGASG